MDTWILSSDISEIHTQGSEKTPSEDTRARADDLEEYEPIQHERRVSALFVLVIMIGIHCFLHLVSAAVQPPL